MAQYRDPTEPVVNTVYVIFGLVVAAAVLGLVTTFFGADQGSMFGWRDRDVCVDTRSGIVQVRDVGESASDLRSGVHSAYRNVTLCVGQPDVTQRIVRTFTELPTFLVFLGALLLAIRLLRGTTGNGMFTGRTAKRMSSLGWFVLVGELAATLCESVARFWLANTMVTYQIPILSWIGDWNMPILALILGVVLISFSRITRISVMMREEIDGTV